MEIILKNKKIEKSMIKSTNLGTTPKEIKKFKNEEIVKREKIPKKERQSAKMGEVLKHF